MNSLIHQLKGAGKALLLLNIALALFNFTILKDNRHVNLLILGDQCQAVAAANDQLAAFNRFLPE